MFFTSGLIFIFGSGRGSRVSCKSTCSKWLRYKCVSPMVWIKSPAFKPVTCATIMSRSAYEAMLKGTPKKVSALRWYICRLKRPSAT